MADELNSRLISSLNKATEESEIKNILEDIEEIGSPVFLDSLVDGFERNINKSFSHYFFEPLEKISSPKIGEYLNKIVSIIIDKKPSTFVYFLRILTNSKYFPEDTTRIVIDIVNNLEDPEYREKFYLDDWDLGSCLSYLRGAEKIDVVEDSLKRIFMTSLLGRQERADALWHLLRVEPKENKFTFIINKLDEIKGTESEVILVRELIKSKWSGGRVPALKQLIKTQGSDISRELIEKAEKESLKIETANREKIQESEQNEFAHFTLINEIISLREKINFKIKSKFNVNEDLLPPNEIIIYLSKVPMDRSQLIDNSLSLRTIIGAFNKKIMNHDLADVEKEPLLREVPARDQNRPINQFYLFAHSRKINIDFGLYGLRSLNQLINKVAAHSRENDEELINELRKHNILESYNQDDWKMIQETILLKYKKFLTDFEVNL